MGHDVEKPISLEVNIEFIEFRETGGALIGSRAPISQKSNGFHLEFRPFCLSRGNTFSSKVFPSCFQLVS
jgi:hypothetical protein